MLQFRESFVGRPRANELHDPTESGNSALISGSHSHRVPLAPSDELDELLLAAVKGTPTLPPLIVLIWSFESLASIPRVPLSISLSITIPLARRRSRPASAGKRIWGTPAARPGLSRRGVGGVCFRIASIPCGCESATIPRSASELCRELFLVFEPRLHQSRSNANCFLPVPEQWFNSLFCSVGLEACRACSSRTSFSDRDSTGAAVLAASSFSCLSPLPNVLVVAEQQILHSFCLLRCPELIERVGRFGRRRQGERFRFMALFLQRRRCSAGLQVSFSACGEAVVVMDLEEIMAAAVLAPDSIFDVGTIRGELDVHQSGQVQYAAHGFTKRSFIPSGCGGPRRCKTFASGSSSAE